MNHSSIFRSLNGGSYWNASRQRSAFQVVDIAKFRVSADAARKSYQLSVDIPSRKLYAPVGSFHSALLKEFCEEVSRLFKALRARGVTIAIQSSDEDDQQIESRARAMNGGARASSQSRSRRKVDLTLDRKWQPPSSVSQIPVRPRCGELVGVS